MGSKRCSFKEGNRRCTRNGFGNPPLCRAHATHINLNGAGSPTEDSPLFDLLDFADRALSGSRSDIAGQIGALFGEFLSGTANGHTAQATGPSGPAPQAPPPPAEEDPRMVLGFDPDEKLTAADVKNRKRALAGIYHPDRGGSERAMKRVNDAADRLLKTL